MRLLLLSLPALALVGGCAGYAIDYTKPKTSIVAPELARYGLSDAQSRCLGERLGTDLSVWQLRQLQIRAASVTRGYADPTRLTPSDLVYVATHVKDPKVGVEVARAAEACGLRAQRATVTAVAPRPQPARDVTASAPPAPPPRPAPPPPVAATTPSSAKATWISLGAAPTGQSIAVDASSLREEGAYRTGWFRLAKAGETSRTSNSYLLRVDCRARTINSMELRKHGPNGAVTEQRSFGPNGEGANPVESGTVLEIAYLSLCS